MKVIVELFAFLRYRKKLWLVPVISIMFIFGALVILAESSVVTPFIYSLF